MCKGCPDCKNCNSNMSQLADRVKANMKRSAIVGGTYWVGGKYIDYFNTPSSDRTKQALLVAASDAVQGSVHDIISDPAGLNMALTDVPAIESMEVGAIYTATTQFLIKIDDRPALVRFLHSMGSSVVGRAVTDQLAM